MPAAPRAILLNTDLSGLPYARRVVRNTARDSLLLERSNVFRLIDPEAPRLSIADRSGRSIANAAVGAFNWTNTTVSLSTADAAFNNKTVFSLTGEPVWSFATGTGAGPIPASFSFLTVLSIPASVLSALSSGTVDRTIFASFGPDIAAGPWLWVYSNSGGANRGFGFHSLLTSGPSQTNFATLPAADVPMLVGVRFRQDTQTSRIYLNDGATPAATKSNHTGTIGQDASRVFTPCSYTGAASRGWIGKIGAMLWMDDTGTDRMSDAEWAALVTAWNAYYRGV
jgi:hypothetical protein